MKRLSKRLSQGSQKSQKKSEGDSDGPEIIDYRGVSVQLMVDTLKAVEDGTAASGVRIFVAVASISSEVLMGAVIKLIGVRKDGKMTGTVAYVAGIVTFSAHQVREKRRSEWTVEDVAEHVVLAVTRSHELIYLDVIPDEEDVGQEYQGAFVSQARSCTFASLVAALVAHYEKKGVDLGKQFVWLDLFGANQPLLTSPERELAHGVRQKREALLTNGLHVAIDKFDERLIFFDLWDDPAALRRAWCVWEIYGSIRHDKPVHPIFAPGQDQAFLDVLLRKQGPDEITQTFADIDTRNAQCFKAEDKAMIDAAIETQLKDGYTTLNASILVGMRDWLTEITHAAVAKAESKLAHAEDEEEAKVDFALVLHQAGFFFNNQGKLEDALAHYQKALDIRKAALGLQADVAATQNNMAWIFAKQGRYAEAMQYYEEALGLLKAKLGEQHCDVAATLNNVGLVLNAQGKYDEALRYLDEALTMRKATIGEQNPLTGSTLSNIGVVYCNQGLFEMALKCFEKALSMKKAVLGELHPSVAATLCGMGQLRSLQGRREEALQLHEQALGIRQEKLNHVHVAESLACIAGVHCSQGRADKAMEFYTRAIGIASEEVGARSPQVARILHGTAETYKAQGDRAEATRLFRQALDLRKNFLGDAHPDTVATQAALEDLLGDQGCG